MNPRRKIVIATLLGLVVLLATGTAYAVTFGANLRVTIGGRPIGFTVPGLRTRSALAATVNEEPIYWTEVEQEVQRAAAQFNVPVSGAEGEKQRSELTGLILDQLIDQRLIAQAARQRGVEANDTQVGAELERIKQNFGGEQGFQAALAQRNLTITDVRRLLRVNLTVRALMPLITKAEVSDAEIRKYFGERRAQYDEPERVHASHILIRAANPQQEERAQQTLLLIRGRLAKGEKFADLARQYSEDPGSKERGGDLGFVGRGTTVPEFEQAVFTLPPGQISAPVKTQFGYHMILVHERKSARQATFEQVKEKIRTQLLEERQEAAFQKWLQAERKQATIRRLPRPVS